MAKTSAAVGVLFMVLMAFAIQETQATLILKSILLYNLYKKLTAPRTPAVVPTPQVTVRPIPVTAPPVFPAPVTKPVYARVTAGTRPAGFGDGRKL